MSQINERASRQAKNRARKLQQKRSTQLPLVAQSHLYGLLSVASTFSAPFDPVSRIDKFQESLELVKIEISIPRPVKAAENTGEGLSVLISHGHGSTLLLVPRKW
jgi:hypothetical protein